MHNAPIYMQGDPVYYAGEKHRQALTNKDGKPLKGWIHASVLNQDDVYVVWFPETKESDSYIIGAGNLSRARPAKVEKVVHDGPEVMPVRRRKAAEEE